MPDDQDPIYDFPPPSIELDSDDANPEDDLVIPDGLLDAAFGASTISSQVDTCYLAFGFQCKYRRHHGLRSSPLAGDVGTRKQAFWRTHGGAGSKVVTFVASAIGKLPKVPSPITNNPNEVLMWDEIVIPNTSQMLNGMPIFTIAGLYVYELQQAPSDDDVLQGGISPFSTSIASQQTIRVSDFAQYLAGPTLPPTGFTGDEIVF